MSRWTESREHCWSRAHCRACRHDKSFRESLFRQGWTDAVDFPCPFHENPPNPQEGPGTRLMRLLRRLGFRHSPKCGCQDMALKMNLRGAQWCRENIGEILGVMRQAASDPASNPMKLPFIEWGARRLILHCAQ